jgi:hypothetical protein
MHHDVNMRTTIDISDAVLREMRMIADRSKRPFRTIVEETLQRGLAHPTKPTIERKVRIEPHPIGIKAGMRGMSMNQMYDQIEAEEGNIRQ